MPAARLVRCHRTRMRPGHAPANASKKRWNATLITRKCSHDGADAGRVRWEVRARPCFFSVQKLYTFACLVSCTKQKNDGPLRSSASRRPVRNRIKACDFTGHVSEQQFCSSQVCPHPAEGINWGELKVFCFTNAKQM